MALTTVLLVDDEEKVRDGIGRILVHAGYHLLLAASGEEALETLSVQPADVVIADQHMGGMTGLRLLELVQDRCPHAVRILLTGSPDLETAISAINRGKIFRFLQKPCDAVELEVTLNFAAEQVVQDRKNRALLATLRALSAS